MAIMPVGAPRGLEAAGRDLGDGERRPLVGGGGEGGNRIGLLGGRRVLRAPPQSSEDRRDLTDGMPAKSAPAAITTAITWTLRGSPRRGLLGVRIGIRVGRTGRRLLERHWRYTKSGGWREESSLHAREPTVCAEPDTLN